MTGYQCLHTQLETVAAHAATAIAMQIKQGESYTKYTYAQVVTAAQQLAAKLLVAGVKPETTIAIILENRPEWIITYFAILYAGAIAVPIDPQTLPDDVNFFLRDTACQIIFTSTKFVTTVLAAQRNSVAVQKIIVLDAALDEENVAAKIISYTAFTRGEVATVNFPQVAPNAVASILYTSGTIARPKGVMLTHQNFYADFNSASKIKLLSGKHNVMVLLPLHHAFPFLATVLIPLFTQNTLTFAPNLQSEELLASMRETGVTVFAGVPQIFALFAKRIQEQLKQQPIMVRYSFAMACEIFWWLRRATKINLAKYLFKKIHQPFGNKLQFFVSGGAKLNSQVERFLVKVGFTILQGYGLTETAPAVSFNSVGHEKIGSAGKALPDVEIKIATPDASGTGEVVIRGPNVMLGYYKMPQATNEVLKDGWFYSGDLGYLDRDGYLFITGRKKEIIVLSSGKKIVPEEVEAHYATSKYIKELCVLALDAIAADQLVAVIHPDFAYFQQTGGVNIYQTIRWSLETLSKNYPAYKRILGFVLTKDDLPRTPLGKLKRYEIRASYVNQLPGKVASSKSAAPALTAEEIQLLDSPLARKVSDALKQTLDKQVAINLADHLELDLGLDSLRRIELLGAIEKACGVHLEPQVMAQILTVKELIILVQQAQQHQQLTIDKTLESFSWKTTLTTVPDAAITAQIALLPSFFATAAFSMFCSVSYLLFKILWRLKVQGLANIPRNKTLVFCSNHTSFLDGFIFVAAMPRWLRDKIFILGIRDVFETAFIKRHLRLTRVIPVDAAQNLVTAMQASAYVLQHGKSVVIFPEGERSIDGTVKSFKKGVGILAQELNVELLPVYIDGAFAAWPRGQRWPKLKPLQIIFGKPCAVADLTAQGQALGAPDVYAAIALGIKAEVEKLRP